MRKATFVYAIYIAATPAKVWTALVDGEITKQYWAHANISDWKPGSKWERQRGDGSGTVDIAGTIVESAPPHRLIMTWARPGELSNPAKVSRVQVEITRHKPSVVRLMLTHDELEPGSEMAQGIATGWPQVLSNLKTLLKTGKAVAMW